MGFASDKLARWGARPKFCKTALLPENPAGAPFYAGIHIIRIGVFWGNDGDRTVRKDGD